MKSELQGGVGTSATFLRLVMSCKSTDFFFIQVAYSRPYYFPIQAREVGHVIWFEIRLQHALVAFPLLKLFRIEEFVNSGQRSKERANPPAVDGKRGVSKAVGSE